jgi:hypothetical protein
MEVDPNQRYGCGCARPDEAAGEAGRRVAGVFLVSGQSVIARVLPFSAVLGR